MAEKPETKPYLSAAFLCERVLQEKDEVLTAVRIIDTMFVTVPKGLPEGLNPTIQITVLLAFKKAPGDQSQKHQAMLRLHGPSGPMKEPPPTLDFFFKPDELAGANLIITIGLGIKEFGTFGIDVFVDNQPVTRIPFRLLERQEETPTATH